LLNTKNRTQVAPEIRFVKIVIKNGLNYFVVKKIDICFLKSLFSFGSPVVFSICIVKNMLFMFGKDDAGQVLPKEREFIF